MRIKILNEKKYAEDLINGGAIKGTIGQAIYILGKYYYSLGLSTDDVFTNISQYVHDNLPPTEKNAKYNNPCYLKSVCSSAQNKQLSKIDSIPITKNEIERIEQLGAPHLQRFAFTLLCLAKHNQMIYEDNTGYIKVIPKTRSSKQKNKGYTGVDLSKIANIQGGNKDKRASWERALQNMGMLDCSVPDKYGAQQYNVTFIDTSGKAVLQIEDLRDLGLIWRKWNGECVTTCEKCGRPILQNKNRTKKYCSDCVKYQPKEIRYISCLDCGKIIAVPSMARRTCRCPECQLMHRRELDKKRMREHREKTRRQIGL